MENSGSLVDFIRNFDIVNNALEMRTLLRWNGRDLRNKENLAEHTHLVTACAIKLYDTIKREKGIFQDDEFEDIIKLAMLHDSLELLRGDILSITKDTIPGLRDAVDQEEELFLGRYVDLQSDVVKDVVKLADLMACYKFVENELRFPSNDYMIDVYKTTKKKFDDALEAFLFKHKMQDVKIEKNVTSRFIKGYQDDAGIDIILLEDVTFMPMTTTSFGLKVNITPSEGQMSLLCARTSAANQGLVVAMCPIDPNYTGEVTAIVHNVSNHIIKYKKGESFCQFVTVKTDRVNNMVGGVKNEGKRSDGKRGSTGR